MAQGRFARTTLATAVGLLAAGLTAGAHAQFEPQGLYSAQSILDADVYFEAAPGTEAGSVADILLGDDMRVHALVVRPDTGVGLGDNPLVVTNPHYHLVTHEDDEGQITHDVIIDTPEEALEEMPHYDQDWWDLARERARDAWDTTQEGAISAWHYTREGADRIGEGAESAWERTQEGARRAGEAIEGAIDHMRD
ncbi:PRC-barrel domain containing protein [Halomonas campisalis]|uniref:PRC-barrel domain containing protein n=1 Tax=Billgrantia campisalis TaxID=74661 RepID=A0ABS9P922_9GAMM|nr:PRC-barrel domain containing protein [Halomonas campisalis]MCG6657712.1 PRC-barrel domain containing protein [Halomonas campisalis]MDR5862516.1 PRC-barrel domain containing protein [Halomonas campisalis]